MRDGRFQPGEGPSRGLLRDCTTGCGTDGSFYTTNNNPAQDEGYHPHAASTYLTEHIGGIYSVEQGREITGFTSSQLPLPKSTFSEDTESQYADELRRQAYIQTLGRSHPSI